MKYFVLFFFGLATVYCDDVNLDNFAAGNNKFSFDVYKEIKATENGNFLFCPLSAEIILGLTRVGARGKTGAEMSKALHLPDDVNKIERIFKTLTPKLKSDEGYTLNSANRMYLQMDYEIRKDFINIAQNSFLADVENVDFNKKDETAGAINQWVSDQTHGKIKNLIDPNMFTTDSRIVLVNALYFKSTWKTKFNEQDTKTKPFYLNNNNHVDVDMMEVTNYFRYFNNEELKAKFLEMPYLGDQYSMVFVLPHDKEGLAILENKLEDVINETRGYEVKVHVQVPKFKTEFKVELTGLGVKDAFTDYADLTGISVSSQELLKISDVIQKAVVEVDEEGTTAAASTAVHVVTTYSLIQPVIQEFNADHPFIYYIKGPNGVMFIGRYVQK
ncbi:hypothetical protein RN001_014923 [Aquatica leii]|uniref:Serpin domain-containing protein n=1 Tax=Aquatica leii TaxID=1421715 RepID=A0AAN7SBY9_9COLE|nr:hypothetical protein RN001_014923 [Aquatica leii]